MLLRTISEEETGTLELKLYSQARVVFIARGSLPYVLSAANAFSSAWEQNQREASEAERARSPVPRKPRRKG